MNEYVTHLGRRYPIVQEVTGTWRLRSRSKHNPINIGLGTAILKEAKRVAIQELEKSGTTPRNCGSGTVDDLIAIYKTLPKRCLPKVADGNASRLKAAVLLATGKTTAVVKYSEIGPKFWRDFMAKKQGLEQVDLATRRKENAAINSAVKQAASLFIKSLLPLYKEHGIDLPADIVTVQWLPTMKTRPPKAKVDDLDSAIRKLRDDYPEMYFCLGLARWAGLRREEIQFCARHWIVEDSKGRIKIEMEDRPDEEFMTKTGEVYEATIIDPAFASDVLTVKPRKLIVQLQEPNRSRWFERVPQEWLRPYVGESKRPLHRLRGLYADEVKRITEDAIAARSEALKEVQKNLGHTTTKTAEAHYLSE